MKHLYLVKTLMLCLVSIVFASPREAVIAQTKAESKNHQFVVETLESSPNRAWPICGLLSFHAASKAIGKDIPLESLLDGKYISDARFGSNSYDLEQLAFDQGMFTASFDYLNATNLENSYLPCILSLKKRSDAKCEGGHWVVYLGMENGKAIIYDSLATPPVSPVKFSELMTRWDGHAIQVSGAPITQANKVVLMLPSLMKFFIIGVLCFLLAGVIDIFSKRWSKSMTAVSILVALVSICIFWQYFNNHSVYHNPTSAFWMAETIKEKVGFPEATFEEVVELSTKRSACGALIDARAERDFSVSTIPGAISVGVNLGVVEFRRAVSTLDRSDPIIVFCSSKSCIWAEIVAKRLRLFGFENIKIFRRGIVGYVEEIADSRFQLKQ